MSDIGERVIDTMSALRKALKIARKPIKRKAPRRTKDPAVSDPKYLEWIRTLPCVVCWGFPRGHQPPGTCLIFWQYERDNGNPSQNSRTEAAHVGDHAGYRRASDRTAIPLCGLEHHREGPYSHHKLTAPGAFWQQHGLDRDALIAALNASYDAQATDTR